MLTRKETEKRLKERVVQLEKENERLRERKELAYLPGETLPTEDLVRVLREELRCTHEELRQLKKAVKASQILLQPLLEDWGNE